MEPHQKNRIKSAMIVYALEEALGNFVIQNEDQVNNINEDSRKLISEREKSKGRNVSEKNVTLLVESSYLDEIFNFAIDITEGTTYNEHIKSLKTYSSLLSIFDIRNAISHPNRPFPQCYWFRAATIASDPLIDLLGLVGVRQALSSAVSENLNPPPEDWINNVIWAIPNTLPRIFDHDITGLLGREKEFKNLKSVLSKLRNNLIAVVAPGGIGKTALILQFLKDLSLNPKWSEKINAIVFCTLKNERLTADGIEKIEAIDGIDQIEESILSDLSLLYTEYEFDSFEEACIKLENEKVLLCIDNLETLLLHSQKEFIEFNQSLPLSWRVVVTSRISVDSATTVSLDPLIKRHAENLGRSYFRKRGINTFEQIQIENIAESSHNNPLAIRLTIDAYLKGADISKSIERTQKDIAQFSYKNFIELLSDKSIGILEAIYVLEDSDKSELISLLGYTNEEITESLNDLSKTSLVIRKTSEIGSDRYGLRESIRDLLLVNPKNIEIRKNISENVRKRKVKILEQTKIDEQLGVSKFDEYFIEKDTEENIHELIVDLNKFLRRQNSRRNHKDLALLKTRFNEALKFSPNDYQLNYHYSRVLRSFKDKLGELTYLNKCLSIRPNSARVRFSLALYNFYSSEYQLSADGFSKLIEEGLNNPIKSNDRFAFSVTKCHLQSILHLGDYSKIESLTKNWENDKNWKVLYGTYYASSLKRSVEIETRDIENLQKKMIKSMDIFSKLFETEGYPVVSSVEALKLVKEIDYKLVQIKSINNYFKKKSVDFVANHFFGIAENLRNYDIDSAEPQKILKNFYDIDIKENALKKVKWYKPFKTLIYDSEHISELIEEGYTIVEVYYIPQTDYGASSYLFAKDEKENQYYLMVNNFDKGWNRWGYIKLKDKLAIKYIPSEDRSKPLPAMEIIDIDQFELG